MITSDQKRSGCPFGHGQPQATRRTLLTGLAALGGGLAMDGVASTPAEAGISAMHRQTFQGKHQAGVVTAQPAHGLIASFDVLAGSREELATTFRTLTDRIRFLMRGGSPVPSDVKFPPNDSGLLGPQIQPDDLTITVSVGASLFDDRFGLAALKPRQLVEMEEFPNDALNADLCHGDLLLQICANKADTVLHALRDVIKTMPDMVAVRWTQDGFLPLEPPGPTRAKVKETPRNLLGFKDGTANIDHTDPDLMNCHVWVMQGAKEPAWAVNGSYQVVRIIRQYVERWDRTTLQEQQTIIGRDKMSGAPLGKPREHDDPAYAADPKGDRIPMDAHIRLANPRTAETNGSLILRRGYNYSRGVTQAGQLDMGLLFVCYQASLQSGFLAVQNRLNGEPLEEYIKPVGGGYFFVLPGVTTASGYLGERLFGPEA